MTTTVIHCDKCKREIAEGRSRLDVVAGPIAATRPTVDLCRECAAAFFGAWLESPNPTEAPTDGR